LISNGNRNFKCCENTEDEKRTVQTLWDSFGGPESWPGEEPKRQKGSGLKSVGLDIVARYFYRLFNCIATNGTLASFTLYKIAYIKLNKWR